jgi:hypothetical protein
LDMTKYNSDTNATKDGDPDKKGMVKYLWQIAKGGSGLEYYKVKENQDDSKNPEEGKNESWFKFGDGNWRPFVTYIGGGAVIIGAGVAIFWKQISDWWNGPAEEQGEGKTEENEKEEENE